MCWKIKRSLTVQQLAVVQDSYIETKMEFEDTYLHEVLLEPVSDDIPSRMILDNGKGARQSQQENLGR
jgi:hypothetical protein